MKQISLSLLFVAFIAACFVSCKKDKNEALALPAGPQDTVTSFMVSFYHTVDSTTDVGACDDPDGPGPMQANIGGVSLKKNSTYIVTFMIEDATNPSQSIYLDKKIKNNGKDFKLCMGNPLGISIVAKDSDGSLPIGLVNELVTSSSTGNDKISFTIKYQKGVKDGSCDPGIMYYNCSLPVTIY